MPAEPISAVTGGRKTSISFADVARVMCNAFAATLFWALVVGPGRATAEAAFEPTRFTVEMRGQGPDVVLIPGLASSRSVWDMEADRLQSHYRLHLIQLRGFAGEPAGANASGPVLQPTVDELHRYFQAEGLMDGTVIGHSLGGLIGLLLAEREPKDVKRLMMVDSLPFSAVLVAGPRATVATVERRATIMRDRMLRESQDAYAAAEERFMARMVKSLDGRAAALAAARASDHVVVAAALYDDMTTDARPDLPNVKAAVTVLYPWDASAGVSQAAIDALYQSVFATLPNKQLIRVDGSYHFIMYDQPAAFDLQVRNFLAR